MATEEIVNKVQKSNLIQLDLANYKPIETIVSIDLKENLWEGFVLKEKDFRAFLSSHDWQQYKGKVAAVYCSADAIIPTWAFMLVISKLEENGIQAYVGNPEEVEREITRLNIAKVDASKYIDGKIIIKGCADIASPAFVMAELLKKLQPVASSIMYGEPCSTVPVFKKKKK
ncbi:MAG: DUF2480 family protein [Brumimicrobium sp.]|nr:DUF2480 family protein [Brumimicrobium sp.]